MSLYHVDAYGVPPLKVARLEGIILSRHAQQRAAEKAIELAKVDLTYFDLTEWTLIELEVEKGIPIKLVVRRKLNIINDLVAVFNRTDKLWVTLWINHRRDKHSTLDKRPYSRP